MLTSKLNGQTSHPIRHLLASLELLGILGIKEKHRMEVSVTHMADNWSRKSVVDDVLLGLCDDGGQGRDRHTRVGCDRPAARPECNVGVVAVVPSSPQASPLLLLYGVLELPGPVLAGQVAHCLGLLVQLCLGAVEL